MLIKQMKLEVASPCQNRCLLCAHQGMIRYAPSYQLQLEDLEWFLQVTKESDYFVENIRLHGPGEPTLWRHFNEGIKLLSESDNIGTIFVATNGQALQMISEETFSRIDEIVVSVYDNFTNNKFLNTVLAKYDKTVKKIEKIKFRKVTLSEEAMIPCQCICMGPMLFGRKLFYYCGPPVFDVLELLEEGIEDHEYLYCDVAPFYMENYKSRQEGGMNLCKYCWANSKATTVMEDWSSLE